MAWTTPITVATNDILTAAQYNQSVRDNMLEMAPAKATGSGNLFMGVAANQIAERVVGSSVVAAMESTTSTSYGDLTTVGPLVTANCTAAIVFISAKMSNPNEGRSATVSVAISGATTRAASDDWCLSVGGSAANNPIRVGAAMAFALNSGSNTFTMKYKSQAGYTPSYFEDREMVVIPL